MPSLAITRRLPARAYERLRAVPDLRIVENPDDAVLSPDGLRTLALGADALICTLADRIDASLLQALSPRLKVVSQYAVGVNNIDLDAARALGIVVANTPDVLTDATAELAVTLMLACARRVVEGDQWVRQGRFTGWSPTLMLGRRLTGRTVGIVGTGRIGRRTAEMVAGGFGCSVLAWSRTPRLEWAAGLGARYVDLNTLWSNADVVSLHCALTPETRHLLDADALDRLAPHATVINTARGPVIDEAALVERLRSGRIAAAGLDVFEREPALADGLAALSNVVLLPHVGSATKTARDDMAELCVGAVLDVLGGRRPSNAVG